MTIGEIIGMWGLLVTVILWTFHKLKYKDAKPKKKPAKVVGFDSYKLYNVRRMESDSVS